MAIEESLRALDGVAEAIVEESEGTPVGVRVQLEAGVDERAVADSIRRILTQHGYRARLAPPRARTEPPAAPPPPAVLHLRPVEAPAEEGRPAGRSASFASLPSLASFASLEEVAVTQTADGVMVRLSDDTGRVAERRTRPATAAVSEAIVSCVSELIDPSVPQPGLLLAEFRQSGGAEVATVVLDLGGGRRAAGAAVVSAGREYALAAAAWTALHPLP